MAFNRLTFLVTGAARGIGRGLSRQLLAAGHRVFLVDNNKDEIEHLRPLLLKTHRAEEDFLLEYVDVTDPALVKQAASRAASVFGPRLDCLVNNAAYTEGVGYAGGLENLSLEDWNRSLAVNLTGPMLMTQACLDLLAEARGCVVHMSSTRAFQSEPNNEPYAATKAGLVGLAQSMSTSLAPRGVRVSAILPGWISAAHESRAGDEGGADWDTGLSAEDHRWQLTGRVGKVEDIVKAVMYLVENDGVTGAELVVDGGVTRKMVYPE